MIAIHRIKGFLLRHIYEIFASIDRKADIVLFPTIDLLIFGLLTVYINRFDVNPGLAGAILGGIILWTLIYNIQRDMSFSLLEDAWSRNMYNLFSTPLKVSEIIVGTLVLSVIKVTITIIVILFLSYGLFQFNLFEFGTIMIFYIFNIFVFAWAFGFFTSSLILRYGIRVQAMAWSLVLLIYPISGVFYPISILPAPLALAAKFLPISYVFEGFRRIIIEGTWPVTGELFVICLLNLVYLLFGIWMFWYGFKNAKDRGWFIHPS